MASKKYYAVKCGRTPGIYRTWDDCKKMVTGYPGAVFKGFMTLEEAEEYLNGSLPAIANADNGMVQAGKNDTNIRSIRTGEDSIATEELPSVYAFVDGSYNSAAKVYGYGGFLFHNGKKFILQGNGAEEEMASMRNVAGEILGSMAAIEKALELGLTEIVIYYDYAGIEQWATGGWKRNKAGTIQYYDYIQAVKDKILIQFVKVKGHSGVEGNEEADRLAKQAVGIE